MSNLNEMKTYIKEDIESISIEQKLVNELKKYIRGAEIKIKQNIGILKIEIKQYDYYDVYIVDCIGKTDTEIIQEIISMYINNLVFNITNKQ